MKRFGLTAVRGTLLLVLGVALGATVAGAATITWNNASGGAWSNPSNWTPNNVPDAAGETAVLPALSGAYQVTLDVSPACDGLEIAAGDPTLDVNGQSLAGITLVTNRGSIANFTGTYDSDRIRNEAGGSVSVADGQAISLVRHLWNDGRIVLGSTTAAASVEDTLELEGAGEWTVDGTLTTTILEIHEGVTVHGGGSILDRITFNEGLIHADAENGTLFHPFGIINRPTGTVRISNNCMLHVRSGYLENAGLLENGEGGGRLRVGWYDESMGTIFVKPGGRIVATPGDLEIHCGVFANPVIERSGESGAVRILLATAENLTVAEGAELVVVTLLTTQIHREDIVNNGIIRVQGVMQFGNADYAVQHAIKGSGKIVLEGGKLGMPDEDDALLINQQLIEGCGTIYAPFTNEGTVSLDCSSGEDALVGAPFINRNTFRIVRGKVHVRGAAWVSNSGTIASEGGHIAFEGGVTLDNRIGSLQSNRGMIDLGGNGGGTVLGGRLVSNGSGLFGVGKAATLKDVTVSSGATLVTYGNAVLTATGLRFTNEGTNRVTILGKMVLSPTTEYVQTSGLTSIERGTLTTTRDLRIEGGVLRGGGTITGNVVNSALMMPDPAQGVLKIAGSYRQLASATFHAMLGGTSATANSRLDVTGAASLDGSLATSTLGSFHPAAGSTFQLMSFASVDGRFLPFREATPEGNLDMSPVYGTDSFGLQFVRPQVAVEGSRPASLAFYGQRSRQGASFVLELPQSSLLKGRVYDAQGREVARLTDGVREPGVHTFAIGGAGSSMSAGVYFARMVITHGGTSEVKTARVTLLQ